MKSEASLRRHLVELEARNLIVRARSSNGKRYRVKNPRGEDLIFGIDISPLLYSAEAIEAAAESAREKAALIKYHRHEVYALLSEITACQEVMNPGDEPVIDGAPVSAIRESLRRETQIDVLAATGEKLRAALAAHAKMSGRDVQNERHIHDSHKEYLLIERSSDCEVSDRAKQAKNEESAKLEMTKSSDCLENQAQRDLNRTPSVTLSDIMRACPGAMQFAGKPMHNIEDLRDFGWRLGAMIPIPETLMRKAAEKHGVLAVVLTVLGLVERGEKIRNAAGYFRSVLLGKRAQSFLPTQFLMSAGT